jgi:flavorubredoxin
MIKLVSADIYQIGECVVGQTLHEAVRVYVMTNNGSPILIDCGSHLHRETIMAELDQVIGDMVPTHIFLTHSELPHAGNLQKVVERWPDIQVITSNILLKYIEIAPIMSLDQITEIQPGGPLNFSGRDLHFVNALLKDQPGSQWIFDPSTGTLFSGDAFGYYHPPEICELFSDETDAGISAEFFKDYHRVTFRFLRWTVPEKLNAVLDGLFQRYPIQIIAPTHGNAIRADIDLHLSRLKQALAEVSGSYIHA